VNFTSPLRKITYHTCHPAEVTFPPLPQPKLVLDLATLKGCKAELTWMIRSWSVRPFVHSEAELSRLTGRLTDWWTDTAIIGSKSLHLTRSIQPNNSSTHRATFACSCKYFPLFVAFYYSLTSLHRVKYEYMLSQSGALSTTRSCWMWSETGPRELPTDWCLSRMSAAMPCMTLIIRYSALADTTSLSGLAQYSN